MLECLKCQNICACACVYFAIGHLKGALKLIASPYAQVLRAASGRLGSRALRLPCERLQLAITRDEHDNALHVTPSERAVIPALRTHAKQDKPIYIRSQPLAFLRQTKRKKNNKKLQSWITSDRIRL